MHKLKPRPDIPKLKIIKVGGFDINGLPTGWSFDGKGDPNSVGEYVSSGWRLYGGYTKDELWVIKMNKPV